MENYNRNYGFKPISEEYKWMTPGWIKELTKHEPDYDLEEYWFNRIAAYEKKLEDDEVYKWLMTSMDFYAKNDAFELCYNIQKAIEIIKKLIADSEKDRAEPVAVDSDGLPF